MSDELEEFEEEEEEGATGKKELETRGRPSNGAPWKALSAAAPSVFGFLAAWMAWWRKRREIGQHVKIRTRRPGSRSKTRTRTGTHPPVSNPLQPTGRLLQDLEELMGELCRGMKKFDHSDDPFNVVL